MKAGLTRRSLLQSTFAAGGALGFGSLTPLTLSARQVQAPEVAGADAATSISRQFARWVTGLRYEDLPPEVVDRAKGLTLQALASALLGSQLPAGRQAIELVTQEEAGVPNGVTVMVDGARATKAGAVFANAELILAGGKWDTFRMLTHPGTCIVPCAFAAAETERASGRDFVTGLVAGYEVMARMAADFIPTLMARGFHAGPVFGIFGAAVAAAKIMRLTEDELTNAIGLCVNLAGGNLESRGLRESAAARNAMLAVALGKQGRQAGENALEGDAGFYHAYAGNNRGDLTYSFVGDTRTSLAALTAGLGEEWLFLETLYRIYSTAGYNIAHVDGHGPALRGARHPVRGRRSGRGGGELAGDAVPEPRLSRPQRGPRRGHGGQHALPHRVRGRAARLPAAGGGARPAGGARPDEAGHDHPVPRDDALRPADSPSSRRTGRATRSRPPGASSFGTSTRRCAASATWFPASPSPRPVSTRSSRPVAISTGPTGRTGSSG